MEKRTNDRIICIPATIPITELNNSNFKRMLLSSNNLFPCGVSRLRLQLHIDIPDLLNSQLQNKDIPYTVIVGMIELSEYEGSEENCDKLSLLEDILNQIPEDVNYFEKMQKRLSHRETETVMYLSILYWEAQMFREEDASIFRLQEGIANIFYPNFSIYCGKDRAVFNGLSDKLFYHRYKRSLLSYIAKIYFLDIYITYGTVKSFFCSVSHLMDLIEFGVFEVEDFVQYFWNQWSFWKDKCGELQNMIDFRGTYHHRLIWLDYSCSFQP